MFTNSGLIRRDRLRTRRLIVVDIENMVGGGVASAYDAWIARMKVEHLVGPVNLEQVIIGTSHFGAIATRVGWTGARILVKSGPDGADLRLLDEMQHWDIPLRFGEVVLVSGDGIFTDAVANLTARSTRVTVLAPADGCSKRLRMAASTCILFDRPTTDERSAA